MGCVRLILSLLIFSGLFSVFGVMPALGAAPYSVEAIGSTLLSEDPSLPWHLEADSLTSYGDGDIIEAEGNVVLTRGKDYLYADFARYFATTGWVLVQGNVQVKLGKDELSASEAEFDLGTNTGWLKNGNVFMAGPHMYFEGAYVMKHEGDRYSFQNAKVTACDAEVPDWSLFAEEVVVEVDGYARLSRSSFQIKDTSVLYSPVLVVPAKVTRQSGLIKPDAGLSSVHGAFVTLPYYWAIDESQDLTAYLSWFERTGVMPALEYRRFPKEKEKLWTALDVLLGSRPIRDDRKDKVDSKDGLIRTNTFRYWFRGMADGQLGESDWYYKANWDFVSDQNFLREFQKRMTGFDATRSASFSFFGRDFTPLDQKRVTEGFFYKDTNYLYLTFGGRYEQDPRLGNGNAPASTDTTPQRLPDFNAYLYKTKLFSTPLEVKASVHSSYTFRRKGTSGFKTELEPVLSVPLNLRYGTAIANAGFRYTLYWGTKDGHVSPLNPTPPGKRQGDGGRFVPEISLTAFTQASKVWALPEKLPFVDTEPLVANAENVGRKEWVSVRHLVQPRLTYSWIPFVEQESRPFYTLDDRVLPRHELTLSLANVFTVKRNTVVENKDGTYALVPSYDDLFRLRILGGYDFDEAKRTRYAGEFKRCPIKDLVVETTFSPNQYISFWNNTAISMYNKGLTRNDLGITLQYKDKATISAAYSSRTSDYNYIQKVRYENRNDIRWERNLQLLHSEVNLNLTDRFSVRLADFTNLRTGKNYERKVSLAYTEQCWRVVGTYAYANKEQSVQFMVELKGILD